MGFKTHKLEKPLQAYNMDGTENKQWTIKYYVNLNLEINARKMTMELLVTGLGKKRIVLGFPCLQEQNLDINWKTGEFSWREPRKWRFLNLPPWKDKKRKLILSKPIIEEIPDDNEWKNQTINSINDDIDLLISYINGDMDRNIWINAKSTIAMEIQAEINLKKKVLPLEEQIPNEFHNFRGKGSTFSWIKTLRPQNQIEGHLYP